MKYPSMNRKSDSRVTIPKLSGGLNMQEALNMVDDNQLSDCENMWWKDGVLRTRPGISVQGINNLHNTFINSDLRTHDFFYEKEDKEHKLYSRIGYKRKTTTPSVFEYQIETFLISDSGQLVDVSTITGIEVNTDSTKAPGRVSYNMLNGNPIKGIGIFCVVGYSDTTFDSKRLYSVYELNNDGSAYSWVKIEESEMYAPLIYINGKGESYADLPTTNDTIFAPASTYEGINLIYRRCRTQFTTDGYKKYVGENPEPLVSLYQIVGSNTFSIPVSVQKNSNIKITARAMFYCNTSNTKENAYIINSDGSNTDEHLEFYIHVGADGTGYSVSLDEEGNLTTEKGYYLVNDNTGNKAFHSISYYPLYSEISNKSISFYFRDHNNSNKYNAIPERSLANNIEIELYTDYSENQNSFFDTTFSTWFGGNKGLNGGTRLFVGGSTSEPNIVRWSDLNKPLYFSENAYAYLGDSSQPITAFAKMADMLVIYKKHEIYYAVYSDTVSSYTASDIQNASVLDVTVSSAAFPITQIHGYIGCDCPGTIQLCDNRLIWATADRKVYMLVSATASSETNVVELSGMIERDLKNRSDTEMKSAISIDWEGHYILISGQYAYLLDYLGNLNSSRRYWYKWKLLNGITEWKSTLVNLDKGCLMGTKTFGDNKYLVSYLISDGDDLDYISATETESIGIESMFQTKVFDFGTPERHKHISQVYLGVGKNSDDITLSFLTDRGTIEGARKIESFEIASEYSPEYIKNAGVSVMQPRISRFGIRANSSGKMAVDSLIIMYKTLGGIK